MSLTSIDKLIDIALQKQAKPSRLAVVMAEETFIIHAIKNAKEMGLIAPFLIGDFQKIKTIAEQESFFLSDSEIIHSDSDIDAAQKALDLIKQNKADMIMKGKISTKVLLHEIVNYKSGFASKQILSHFAIFESPNYHKLFGLTDAAMNISPEIDEKQAIIKNAVNVFHKLGVNIPKVAILAAVEIVNPKIKATIDAEILTRRNKEGIIEGCIVEGPLSLDLAISKESAEIKNINSQLAGDADILIAPDLNSGNILYKSLSYLGNARLAGVILGASFPIILTSRADSEENKLLSIALAICVYN